jgi:cyclophilin family peptidyl-prolyl cis-trans isomerase
MKNGRALLAVIPLVVFLFSGCSGSENKKMTNEKGEAGQEQNTGYINGMLGIKEQAEKNINSAVQKENNKINEAMNEENLDYAKKYNTAEIETNLGKIKVKFYNSESPVTVNNFMKLSDQKFYEGTKFHRVIKGFMIQGGDPNSKDDDWSNDGTGGPGYSFKDEFNSHKLVRGSLAMANSGPNTNGSQFFIVTASSTPWLDGKHTNFGEVISGMDVVDKIENLSVGKNDHPKEDAEIKSIRLENEK